jgi:hypothetical protein
VSTRPAQQLAFSRSPSADYIEVHSPSATMLNKKHQKRSYCNHLTLFTLAQVASDTDHLQVYNCKVIWRGVWYVITEFIGHWFNSFTNNFQEIKMCIFWQIQHGDCSEWQEVIFLARKNYGIHYTYSTM